MESAAELASTNPTLFGIQYQGIHVAICPAQPLIAKLLKLSATGTSVLIAPITAQTLLRARFNRRTRQALQKLNFAFCVNRKLQRALLPTTPLHDLTLSGKLFIELSAQLSKAQQQLLFWGLSTGPRS